MELWVVFAFVAATTQTLRSAGQKQMKSVIGDFGASYVRFSYGLPFAAGIGMTLYGFLYFWIHDGLAHKRWSPPRFLRPRWAEIVKKNHRIHHQKATKDGQGPYGLFF